jgi:hypothetical protein
VAHADLDRVDRVERHEGLDLDRLCRGQRQIPQLLIRDGNDLVLGVLLAAADL